MIISKTPLRISFAGGGTDIRSYYKHNKFGAVLSSSIDSYIYVSVKKQTTLFQEKYRLNYSETEKKVIAIVSNTINIKNIDIQSSQENTSEWDSLAYLSVVCAIEEEFAIEISQENINNFTSVKNILNEINHL